MEKRLFVFDIDDTLLINNTLHSTTVEALRIIKAHGDEIAVCTGRLKSFVQDEIGRHVDYWICANGATLHHHNELIMERCVSDKVTMELYEFVKGHKLTTAFRNAKGYHIPIGYNIGLLQEQKYNFSFTENVYEDTSIERSYNYFLYNVSESDCVIINKWIKDYRLVLSNSFPECYDIFSIDINKETALLELLKGQRFTETIGFGNSDNDVKFLLECNKGYYLSNTKFSKDGLIVLPQVQGSIYRIIKEIYLDA